MKRVLNDILGIVGTEHNVGTLSWFSYHKYFL